jgi:hypothetical protein
MTKNIPAIRLRGIRASMPQGYILGRAAGGDGEVQLLSLNALRGMGIAAAVDVSKLTSSAGFGFFDEGLYASNEKLGTAVFSRQVTFSNGDPGNIVTCLIPATASAVFNIVSGAFNTLVGTITFAPGSKTAVVAWVGGSFVLPAGQTMTLYSPNPADTTLADVSGTVTGRKQ